MLNEFRSTNITWDKATSRIYSPVTANAGDENGRKLVVQIVNGGQVEDLTGATLHLYWETRDKSHDGLDVFDAVDLKKGEFELSYTTGMLSNQGVLNANLVLIDTVGRVVSERFKITVTEGIDNDAIQSENSFTTLTQALIDISNLEQNYAPRLNDLTAQLQQKANYEDIANLTSAKPTFVDSVIEMVNEGTVYVNTTDGFVYLYNSSSSKFENTNVLYQAKGINPNGVTLDNIKDDEFILNYVTKDTSNNLPVASAEPNEVRLNERGNIYFSNGNMIDIIGMTDGTYTEDGVTVVIVGNKVTVSGTATAGKYFKLSGGSGFIPNNAGLEVRDYILPYSPMYCFGLYAVNKASGEDFTVSVRSTVSSNYAGVNTSETKPYDNLSDQSLFGDIFLYIAEGQIINMSFNLFLMPTAYALENAITPNTNVYSNVLKARSKAKFVLSDRTGVAKPLVRMTDIVGGGGETENLKGIYVEGHGDFFYFYIKGSKKDSNKYLRYTFEYWDGESINNGKGWVLGVVDAVEIIDGIVNVLYPVVKAGEWEMAIRLDGRPDFIGCKQHGSEVSFYNKFYIDGTEWVPDNSSFWCNEIKVIEKSTMYDPLDEVTVVGNHTKDYKITVDSIKLRQIIKWTTTQTMGNNDVYTAMLPMIRGNDTTTPHQITAKAYEDATYEEIDVSAPSHGARTARHEPDKWTLYSDATGISASIQSKNKVKLPGANSFIQNSASYNKVYFNYCAPEYTVAVGDVWENEINYELNINL